jgi:hypothetical protein
MYVRSDPKLSLQWHTYDGIGCFVKRRSCGAGDTTLEMCQRVMPFDLTQLPRFGLKVQLDQPINFLGTTPSRVGWGSSGAKIGVQA